MGDDDLDKFDFRTSLISGPLGEPRKREKKERPPVSRFFEER